MGEKSVTKVAIRGALVAIGVSIPGGIVGYLIL